MSMSWRVLGVVAGICAAVWIISASMFTVMESQQAVRTELGAIVGTDTKPGLHWKWPCDLVMKFDGRVQALSYTGETFLTNDNRGLIVDFYVKWSIKDAARYSQAAGGS